MKAINVYTQYDSNKNVIGRIIQNEKHEISDRTYRRLMNSRTIGGLAGIYTDAGYDIYVVDKHGNYIALIH